MRRWRLNLVIPLGSTVHYRCQSCKSEVSLRTSWHILILVLGFAVLAYVLPQTISRGEAFTSSVGFAALIYIGYALVTDVLDRRRNPKWHE